MRRQSQKVITYWSYKNFNSENFNKCLGGSLSNCKNCSEYGGRFLEVFDAHAPLKKKVVRANEVPYMTKALRKAFADRSRLENKYYKNRSVESLRAYKKQNNFCSRLYKRERKKYYTNLDPKKITDSKNF